VRRLALLAALGTLACPPATGAPDAAVVPDASLPADAGEADAGAADAGLDDAGVVLAAVVGADLWADVGAPVQLDGSRSTGAVEFEWSFGDGSPAVRGAQPVVTHAFSRPGRFHVVLRVFDARGRSRSALQLVAVTWPPRGRFETASTLTLIDGGVAVVVEDANLLTRVWEGDGRFLSRSMTPTCAGPVSVARLDGDDVAVACRSGDVVVHRPTGRLEPRFGAASRPTAIVRSGAEYAVALGGTNELVVLRAPNQLVRRVSVPDPRGLGALPDGGFLVARFRSIADGGLLTRLDQTGAPTPISLAIDPQGSSDTEIGGVPNLLAAVAVSPDGRTAVVSSLQANVLEGAFRAMKPLTFETSLRAVTSFVDLSTGREQFERRKQWNNRGAAGAVAFSPRGDFLFVAMPANRIIERYDMLDDAPAGTLFDVGQGLAGLAVSEDGRYLYVDAQLSRELVVYDVSDMRALRATPIARVPTVVTEPLSRQLLVGKRLFHDAADPRLTRDGYVACAHCHPDGDEDGLVWDFTDRGEGLRNTLSLLGRAGTGDGPIHWSGNFDEVQDFENDIRGPFGGAGLMAPNDWLVGTTALPLGDAKAGKAQDLDALAAFVSALPDPAPSPSRLPDGGFTEEALRGKAIFERADVQCATCHSGPRLTDSRFLDAGVPLLHDVGTLDAGSGRRLGGALPGIDTPSLVGAWRNPPFLHDGSAATLDDVLRARNAGDRHGVTSVLSAQERAELEAYLRSL
jgi:hypothetical protein